MHIPMSNSRIWIDVKYKKLYIMKVEIADSLRELFSHKETYRSGHNGAHSKTNCFLEQLLLQTIDFTELLII